MLKTLKNLLFIGVGVFVIINTYLLFSIYLSEKKQTEISEDNLAITRERFLGELLLQYYTDIDTCMSNQQDIKNQENCVVEMNKSDLAQKIINLGGESKLSK